MPDMFTSLAAITSHQPKVSGKNSERVPGISPSMKDGIWNERSAALGSHIVTYSKAAGVNAFVQTSFDRTSSLNAIVGTLLDGLVSFWKLDGNSSDAMGSNHGVDTALTYASGKIGSAAVFNGSTSTIDLGTSSTLNLSGAVSGSMWVNWGGSAGSGSIISRATGALTSTFDLRVLTGGDVRFYVGNGFVSSGAGDILPGVWTHVVFTRVSSVGTARIYINNALATSGTPGATASLPATTTWFGRRYDGNYFGGSVDAVGLWSRELTVTEIGILYNGGLGTQYPF